MFDFLTLKRGIDSLVSEKRSLFSEAKDGTFFVQIGWTFSCGTLGSQKKSLVYSLILKLFLGCKMLPHRKIGNGGKQIKLGRSLESWLGKKLRILKQSQVSTRW